MSDTPAPAVSYVIAQANAPAGAAHGPAPVNGVEIATPPGEAHAATFPPFDAHTFPSQLLWLAIAFGALYWLMSRLALPRIATILEERHDRIADDLDEAARLKADSEAAATAYEQALAGARGKAHAIATETRDKLAGEADAGRKSLEAELADKLATAETQITATKNSAMANVKGIAVETADAIIRELVGTPAAPEALDAAVDAALSK